MPAPSSGSVGPHAAAHARAVVLGGYVNGYSIVRALHEGGVRDIAVLDTRRGIATYSRHVSEWIVVPEGNAAYLAALRRLGAEGAPLVLFPTNDRHLEILHALYDELQGTCFIPLNPANTPSAMRKDHQYAWCEKLGVPRPQSVRLATPSDLAQLDALAPPVIVKPATREDMTKAVFRNLRARDPIELAAIRPKVEAALQGGTPLVASEIVPGPSSQIYAYTCYRSKQGRILAEWSGRKLSQYPDDFGVFGSASNEAPEAVSDLGRRLVEGMDLQGIVEPEFKLDPRDGQLKLMEVNLRSMMWHRVGQLDGVNLPLVQFLDAVGSPIPPQKQRGHPTFHYVYFRHELQNLLARRGYGSTFRRVVMTARPRHFAVFNARDPMPFLVNATRGIRGVVSACRRRSESASSSS